jgi:hypothetical protein
MPRPARPRAVSCVREMFDMNAALVQPRVIQKPPQAARADDHGSSPGARGAPHGARSSTTRTRSLSRLMSLYRRALAYTQYGSQPLDVVVLYRFRGV